jgi:hypothetical protein
MWACIFWQSSILKSFNDIIVAPQHNLKEITMFTFDEQYKKFEEVIDRTKQAYEFWYNCLLSTWKDFYKTGK